MVSVAILTLLSPAGSPSPAPGGRSLRDRHGGRQYPSPGAAAPACSGVHHPAGVAIFPMLPFPAGMSTSPPQGLPSGSRPLRDRHVVGANPLSPSPREGSSPGGGRHLPHAPLPRRQSLTRPPSAVPARPVWGAAPPLPCGGRSPTRGQHYLVWPLAQALARGGEARAVSHIYIKDSGVHF